MWGIATDHSNAQFKLYVSKQPFCVEDIPSHNIWKKYTNGKWSTASGVSLKCAIESTDYSGLFSIYLSKKSVLT
jgi:hypothetical protein